MKWIAFPLLLCACGSSNNTNNYPPLDGAAGGGGDMAMMMMVGNIPGPGVANNMSDVNNNFGSTPGDSTPAKATPLGVSMQSDVLVWVDMNSLASGGSDYFVFESGPMAGNFSLGAGGLCASAGITSMTATLWKVANGAEVNPPVHTWMSNGMCLQSMMGDAPLLANTEYLLGIVSSGGAGSYSA